MPVVLLVEGDILARDLLHEAFQKAIEGGPRPPLFNTDRRAEEYMKDNVETGFGHQPKP